MSRARLHSLFGMKFTQVPSQYSNQIREVQARNEVWVCVKAPSHCLSCKSSTALQLFKQLTAVLQTNALQLFKQLTALLQTTDCRKARDKQPTGTEQGSPHCSV
jgi:lactam utilization protein B